MVFKERFTAPVFLEFLRRLLRQSDRRVYLIIDRHPVHRSHKVKNWVKENEDRLRLVFLPSYSPQINPDELLNQDVKSNAVGRQRPGNQTELMGKVRSYLRSRRERQVQLGLDLSIWHNRVATFSSLMGLGAPAGLAPSYKPTGPWPRKRQRHLPTEGRDRPVGRQ